MGKNNDKVAALRELESHPGWRIFTDDVKADHQRALEIMTGNPTGKAWEHGQARGHAAAAIGVLQYIESKIQYLNNEDAGAGTPDVVPVSDEDE